MIRDESVAPLITICIPTHRRPSFLLHALHSCLAQDYRPLEIDVSDDSVRDDSEAIVKALSLPPGITLRYWRNRPSLGQAGSVNRLFNAARAERLVLLHDDDLLLPGAVSAMAAAWNDVRDVVAVYGMQQVLTNDGEIDDAESDYKAAYFKRDRAHVGEQRNLLVSAFWRQFPSNGYLVQTATARAAGYRSFDEVGHACDTDFGIRLAMHSQGKAFLMIDALTSQYRYNLSSLSRSIDVMWKFYDYLVALNTLSAEEAAARDSLLRETAAQATKENALRGRRRSAFRIFRSAYYPRTDNIMKSLYHLGLIVTPRVALVRRIPRLWQQAHLRAAERNSADDVAGLRA